MTRLTTYSLPDIDGVIGGALRILPGDPVRHRLDPDSFGIMLSRYWGPNDKPMQCEVLWSVPPTSSTSINSTSRKLSMRWAPEQAPDRMSMTDFMKKFGNAEILMAEDPHVTDVVIHHNFDGIEPDVEIKRQRFTPDDEWMWKPRR